MLTHSLNCARLMVLSLCNKVSAVCKLGRVKTTEMNEISAQDDLRKPFIASGLVVSAKTIAFCSSMCNQLVLHIFRMRHIAKIREFIVSFFAVYVVYFPNRPASIGIEKCKSVRKIPTAVNANLNVPTGVLCPNNSTCKPPTADGLQSGKCSRLTVIGIKLFEPALRKRRIIFSHDVSPVKKLIGQRPARVISTGGLRHFITRACSGAMGITKCLHQAALAAASVCMPANHRRLSSPLGALTPFNAL